MATANAFLSVRNTFYWSRTACASSDGDYAKAKIYHWLHAEDRSKTLRYSREHQGSPGRPRLV